MGKRFAAAYVLKQAFSTGIPQQLWHLECFQVMGDSGSVEENKEEKNNVSLPVN